MQDSARKFIALRDALIAQSDPQFRHQTGLPLADRTAALLSTLRVDSKTKMLGLIETGGTVYSTEQRVLVLDPAPLTRESLAAWGDYGRRLTDELIVPEENHQFSLVSLMVASPSVDPRAARWARRVKYEPQFARGKLGWASLRFAVLDLSDGRAYTNSMGAPLADILKKAWSV